MSNYSVAILTGGRSRRLDGRAKGLISIDGDTIIGRLLKMMNERSHDVFLVGAPDGPYATIGHRMVSDLHPNKGAPGGVHAALSHSKMDWVMMLPCDLPYMGEEILDEIQPSSAHDAVLYRVKGRPQPLVGLWHRKTLPHLDNALRTGNPSLNELAGQLAVLWLDSGDETPFFNLNTHEDLERLKNGEAQRIRGSYPG